MKKILLLILAVAVFTVCGCDSNLPESSESSVFIPTTEATDSTEPEPYPIVVNDVTVERSPEKVACLSSSLTEIAFELGFGDTIVARDTYCELESVAALPDIGRPTQPDIELIVQLKPEILLISSAIPSKDIVSLEENGIKTILIKNPSNVEDFENVYKALSAIYCGMFDADETANKAYSSISGFFADDSVDLGKFVYITEGYCAAGKDTFESSVLSCFGENVADGNGYISDISFLLENEPDVIILNSAYDANSLYNSDVISKLKAFVDNSIILIDNVYFERPSGRITEIRNYLIKE